MYYTIAYRKSLLRMSNYTQKRSFVIIQVCVSLYFTSELIKDYVTVIAEYTYAKLCTRTFCIMIDGQSTIYDVLLQNVNFSLYYILHEPNLIHGRNLLAKFYP